MTDDDRHRREDDRMTDDDRLDRTLKALLHDDDPETIERVKHLLRCFLRWYERGRKAGRIVTIGFFTAFGAALFTALVTAFYQGLVEQFQRIARIFTGA